MATPVRVGSAGGEYMENVVVLEWTAKLGDPVKAGTTLVTVETAKAATEIAAPSDGFLTAIFTEPGTEVPLSAILGLIGQTRNDDQFDDDAKPPQKQQTDEPIPLLVTPAAASLATRLVASPLARREAARLGIDLRNVPHSSPSGRIKLRDLAQQLPRMLDAQLPIPRAEKDDLGPLKSYRSGQGEGTPVLFIHGFASDAQSWFPIERELSRRHPILKLELPNHGASPRRRVRDFVELSRSVAAAFDALHVENAHVVGHSLGGACALALADIRSRKIASLTLIAPVGLGATINGDFVEGIARAGQLESLGPWLKAMVADANVIGDDYVKAAMAGRVDANLRIAQLQMGRDLFPDATQSFDLRPALSRLECITRILWGKADPILPWQQALSAPGRVALHLFEATGHVPQLERTEDVLAILRTHIRLSEVGL